MEYIYFFIRLFQTLIVLYIISRYMGIILPIISYGYNNEKLKLYKPWTWQKIIVVTILVLIILGFSYYNFKSNLDMPHMDVSEAILMIVLSLFALLLFEFKMTHPFKPYKAFMHFKENDFDKIFNFRDIDLNKIQKSKYSNKTSPIKATTNFIHKEFKFHSNIYETGDEGNNKVTDNSLEHQFQKDEEQTNIISEYGFNITLNQLIDDGLLKHISIDYGIHESSKNDLKLFLEGKKVNQKIVFTKSYGQGINAKIIYKFFNDYTNYYERLNIPTLKTTQIDVLNKLNNIVVWKLNNTLKDNPLSEATFSKYKLNRRV